MRSPDSAVHALTVPLRLNPASLSDLCGALERCGDEVAFLVLQGTGGGFCEGLDLGWIADEDPVRLEPALDLFARSLQGIARFNGITVALVDGAVSGGGLGIVCACDHVIVSGSSSFALPEGQLGLVPGMILSHLTKRLLPSDLRRMVLTGRTLCAQEALDIGLADVLVPSGALDVALKRSFSEMRRCKPGVARALRSLTALEGLSADERCRAGAKLLMEALARPEVRGRLDVIAGLIDRPDPHARARRCDEPLPDTQPPIAHGDRAFPDTQDGTSHG